MRRAKYLKAKDFCIFFGRRQTARTMAENLLRRIRRQSDLCRLWDKFELGMKAPEPIDYDALAKLLDEAVARIEQLERDR
jgi:hypothetical protein